EKTKTTGRKLEKPSETGQSAQPLFTPTEGDADDLKLISGVGPGIEAKLNALGITTYAQIAALSDADRERVEAELNFKGRMNRDNWKAQAKALADGGVDEYVRVFGKKPR